MSGDYKYRHAYFMMRIALLAQHTVFFRHHMPVVDYCSEYFILGGIGFEQR